MRKTYALLAAGVLAAALGVTGGLIVFGKSSDKYAQCREGQVGGGAIGGPFDLVDGQGNSVTDADVITGPTLVYFGYTFCPDVCPFDNQRNAEAVDILEERGIDVKPVFISVDPARDTPEVMGEYAEMMHPRMVGLSGSEDQVKAAANAYKVYYQAQKAEDGFYLVDHTTFTYLMMPGEGFMDFFRREVTAEQIADRVGCFVDAG
ncbi:SCO family protein [Cereibacter sp. SYSU M97828]|nr:SCO family protein [Cereibacter flavus]